MASYLSFRWNHARRQAAAGAKSGRVWLANYVNRHVYGAWRKLGLMRWQFAAWMLIVLISVVGMQRGFTRLNQQWLIAKPASGGVYHEGIIGRVRLVNPLYIENSATSDVAELVYSKLIRTSDGQSIQPDLATDWTVSADKKTYTLKLRDTAYWHDGVKLSAQDVAFTFKLIQNPDTRSTLAGNWDKVVITAPDDRTVVFTLPTSYSGFWAQLAQVGILPQHALQDVQPNLLRLDEFNQRPIGSGPFILDNLDVNSDKITLRRYNEYYGGAPKLDEVQLIQYDASPDLLDAYAKRRLDGMARVEPSEIEQVKSFEGLKLERYRLPAYVGVYFNMSQPQLAADKNIRIALAEAIDRKALVHDVLKDEANVAQYPIPAGYLGFNPAARRVQYDPTAAKSVLDGKFAKPLRLVTSNSGEYPEVAKRVSEAWRAAGVPVEVVSVDSYSLQQNYIRPREYDVLLYGQDIGADSDMYGFWHSSQAADPGLNISVYKSSTADQLLEQARIGRDANFRATKYAEFVKVWSEDVPAVLLYSPTYLYAHTVELTGLSAKGLVTPSDRFRNIQDWAVHETVVPKKQS